EKWPGLKKLYQNRKKDGLEIVGINLDRSAESVTDAGELRGLTWPKVAQGSPRPQIHLPENDKIHELWTSAQHMGRVYFTDRQGILRADCYPNELFGCIHQPLDAKK